MVAKPRLWQGKLGWRGSPLKRSDMASFDDESWNESGAVTTKIPPSFDGRSSWFAYEEAIDDWCDVTELDTDKQGPALRNRLEGEAAIYKSLLDRNALKDPNTGVDYFKRELRPHFVKGSQSDFLWGFSSYSRRTGASRTSSDG